MTQNSRSVLINFQNFCLGFILFFVSSGFGQLYENISNQYDWKTWKIGAGGYVTGIDMHKEGHVLYCRTDVGGAYRLESGSKEWIQLVTTESIPGLRTTSGYNDYGVQSIVSAPGEKNVVYMVFGDGFCYRSENMGDTWTQTALQTYVEQNGTARFQGERLAVDPLNSDIVYYGSHEDGLLRTIDGGTSWKRLSQVPAGSNRHYGIGTVLIDTNSGEVEGRSKIIFVTVHGEGVYQSVDGGDSWQKLNGGPADGEYEDAALDVNGVYYVGQATDQQVWRYKGNTWTMIKSGHSIKDIACDPFNADRFLVTEHGGRTWRTTDGGETWKKLTNSRVSPDIPWQKWCEENWFSTAEYIFDAVTPGRVWIAQGIGVWFTDDVDGNSIVWESMSMGIEELVNNDILSTPGQVPLAAFWDRAVFRLEDPDVYPVRYYPTDRFNSGWDLAHCASVPSFVVATITDHRSCCFLNASGYSDDGGESWQRFASIPEDANWGTIAVSATDPDNIVWLPTDNVMPYYTTDRGESWIQTILPGTSEGGNYVYAGKQSVVTADALLADVFYLYHRKKGVYKSENKGATWKLISTELPMNTGRLSALRAVPDHSGHFYFTAGSDASHPLLRSTDGCLTWQKVESTSDVSLAVFGKPAEGQSYPTLYIYGRAYGVPGIWRSTDEGFSWKKIGVNPTGLASKIVALEGDKNTFGKVYVGFPGNGLAYGVDKTVSGVEGGGKVSPTQHGLLENYPNPFNPKTHIRYQVVEKSRVRMSVFDITGKEVDNLVNQDVMPGTHDVTFDGRHLATGIYVCQAQIGKQTFSQKMTLLK